MNPRLSALILAFLLAPILAAAQAPSRTEVKGHEIGEGAEEFYTKAGYGEFILQCRSAAGDPKKVKKLHCEIPLSALAGERIQVTDPNWEPEAGRKSDKRLGIKLPPVDTAILSGGRLVSVRLGIGRPFAEILPDLVDKYGKPSSASTESLQNGYGATFEVGRAEWSMPDGVIITAIEQVTFADSLGYFRTTDVTFSSRDEAKHPSPEEASRPNLFN
jgi:hypothetical protein